MTKKAYIFIYDDDVGTRSEVKDFIDSLPEVLFWRYDMPHSFYLVSEHSASEIADKISAMTEHEGRFLVAEINSNKQGWLPRRTWRLLNKKRFSTESAAVRSA